MNFRQVEAFRAVMVAGSVSKAGEMLHVTQPAVSRLIAEFERSLNLRLFERSRGRLVPTPEARLLFQEVQVAFSGLERIREAATALHSLRRGRLRLVAETVFAEGFLPRLVAQYQARHPEVMVEIDIGPSPRVADWVAKRWYDLGLLVLPIAEPEVAVEPYARHRAVCVLPHDHRLARCDQITAGDLAEAPFVSLAFGSAFRIEIDRAFEQARVPRVIRTEARTQHAICALVAEGVGLSLVDPCVAADLRDPRLAFRPFVPEVSWQLALVQPLVRTPSLIAQDFAAFLRRARQEPGSQAPA